MALSWGFLDGAVNVHAQIIYAFQAQEQVIAFAIFNTL